MIRQNSCLALPFVLAFLFCFQQCGSVAQADAKDAIDTVAAPRPKSKGSKEVVGWVTPTSARGNAGAAYALTDRSGNVGYYLRPSAGVQLGRYVNVQVRLRGSETTLLDGPTPLLEVEQVGPPDISLGPKAPHSRSASRPVKRKRPRVVAEPSAPEAIEPDIRQTAAMQEQDELVEPSEDNFGDVTLTPIPEIDEREADRTHLFSRNPSGCGGCNRPSCPTCFNGCGIPGKFWVRAEYLYWWSEGMHLPPLVTTGPTGVPHTSILGQPGTVILFGGSPVNGGGRSGGRLTAGMWLNPCQTIGVQGDYFSLASTTTSFSATSPGDPILSRPFFDVNPNPPLPGQAARPGPAAEQVAAPGVIAGTVSVNDPTQFSSAGFNFIYNLCCCKQCYSDACWPSLNGQGGCRVDFLLGYRFYRLSDGVGITENLTTIPPPGSFLVNDSFTSRNLFNGVEFGTMLQKFRGRWSAEVISKIAMGNNNETVAINGSTVASGTPGTLVGGLLAQPSNIGIYQRNEFAVVPQLNFNLTYQFTPSLRAVAGYSFIYWSRVVRAGDQIDLSVNSNLLPANTPTPPIGDTSHPQFVFRATDFWAQGINVGLDYRW